MFISVYHCCDKGVRLKNKLKLNFWLKLSLSTFDWNIRYQLLIETFGVEIWLKLLIAFRCQLLTETFDSISLSTFDSNSLSTFDSNSLSTFDYRRAVEPSSAIFNSNWFVSKVRFESCCLNLIAFRFLSSCLKRSYQMFESNWFRH